MNGVGQGAWVTAPKTLGFWFCSFVQAKRVRRSSGAQPSGLDLVYCIPDREESKDLTLPLSLMSLDHLNMKRGPGGEVQNNLKKIDRYLPAGE